MFDDIYSYRYLYTSVQHRHISSNVQNLKKCLIEKKKSKLDMLLCKLFE